jgi:hypothetical protein
MISIKGKLEWRLNKARFIWRPFGALWPSSYKPRAALRLPGAILFRASGALFPSQDAKLRFSI